MNVSSSRWSLKSSLNFIAVKEYKTAEDNLRHFVDENKQNAQCGSIVEQKATNIKILGCRTADKYWTKYYCFMIDIKMLRQRSINIFYRYFSQRYSIKRNYMISKLSIRRRSLQHNFCKQFPSTTVNKLRLSKLPKERSQHKPSTLWTDLHTNSVLFRSTV